jgi:hypothetical protein
MMKMKFIQNCTNSLAAIVLVLSSLITVQLLPEKATAIEPPPERGTPKDLSGGTITRPPSNCREPEIPGKLAALVMNNGNDYTLSDSPTLWVYVPFPKNSVSSIHLAVYDSAERNPVYDKTFRNLRTPGLVAIPLSPGGRNAFSLKVGQTYRWYLGVKCQSTGDSPDAEIGGWIQRKATTPALKQQLAVPSRQQYKVYQQNQIWYDAINSLTKEYLKDPNNSELKRAWADLLKKLRVK